MVRTNRDWVKIVPGFRPQKLTRDILLRSTRDLAGEPQLLEQLAGSVLDDLDIGPGVLVDRLAEALAKPDLPPELQGGLGVLQERSLWDLPLGNQERVAQPDPSAVHPRGQGSEQSVGAAAEAQPTPEVQPTPEANREPESERAAAPDADPPSGSERPQPTPASSTDFRWEPSNDHISPLQDGVTEFERSLKEFTRWALKQQYGDKWLRQGCGATRKRWLQQAREAGRDTEPESLINEAPLGDLHTIILKTENRDVFDSVFKSMDDFRSDMSLVINLRNKVMHPGRQEIQALQQHDGLAAMQRVAECYSKDLANFINQVYEDLTNSRGVDPEPAEQTVRDRILTNLPDFSAAELVGRDQELDRLRTEFWEDRFKRSISIAGPGGVGKTALLDAFIETLFRRPVQEGEQLKPSIVVYLTAKVQYLEGMDRAPSRVHFRTLNAVAETVVRLLEPERNESMAPDALMNDVYVLCENEPMLFALDNLETLDDDEFSALGSFIANLPAGNKAILTTRDDRIIGDSLPLRRLPVDAGVELLRVRLRGHGQELPESDIPRAKALVEAADGFPLAIVLSANNVANGLALDEAVKKLRGARGIEFQEFSFGSSWETLTNAEREILYFLAVSRKPQRRRALERYCRDDDELNRALTRLRTQVFFVHVDTTAGRSPGLSIAIPHLRDYVRSKGPETLTPDRVTSIRTHANVAALEAESPNVVRALEQVLHVCDDIFRREGAQAGIEYLNQKELEWGRDGRILAKRGYLKHRLRDNVGAKKDLRAAIDAGHQTAEVYFHLGLAQFYSREPQFAEVAARQALSIRPGFEKAERLLGECLVQRARRGSFVLTEPQRREMLREAEEHLRNALYREEAAPWQRNHNESIHARLARVTESV